MDLPRSFRFADDELNDRLIALLKKSEIRHLVGKDGILHYSAGDEELVENDMISSIRNQVFPSWQVLSCPKDWTERYRQYMTQHHIPFTEELTDNQLCFLIPRKYRPHSWKMDDHSSPGDNQGTVSAVPPQRRS